MQISSKSFISILVKEKRSRMVNSRGGVEPRCYTCRGILKIGDEIHSKMIKGGRYTQRHLTCAKKVNLI